MPFGLVGGEQHPFALRPDVNPGVFEARTPGCVVRQHDGDRVRPLRVGLVVVVRTVLAVDARVRMDLSKAREAVLASVLGRLTHRLR